ncbi:transporter [Mesorhizobium sp. L-8-10]|uniref:TolC family outer membrane protein n=1 Tax=Mesorhizobium sp. L-8-10 TaxID=2744523 RepID=UPI0019289418|nr:TolC family outer membrane protein [Mesorhizobium sp. L-8-10]BCH33102.1 transporter [Mesorhizobium sp. L-8-10]
MRILRKGLFAAAILATTALSPASAETLTGAMAKAYQNNAEMNAARAGVRVTDEGVAIAKSGYRPIIAGTSSVTHTSESGVLNSQRLTVGSFGIEIQQRLFDGFQTRNNVRAAEAQVRASDESLRNTEQTVLFNAAAAFMDVIRDRQVAVLRQQNLQFLEEQVRAAKSRFEVGEGTRTDVAQAEASRSSAVAQLASARANVLSVEAVYRRVIGESPGKLASPAAAKGLPKNVDEAISIAAVQHPAILATEHLVDAQNFVVKSTEGQLLPQLSASAGLSRTNRSTSPAAVSIFGSSDGQSDSATIGATLSIPLYQGGRVAAQVRQSKERLGEARIEVDVTRDQVRAAVASAWAQFIAAQEAVAANRDEVSAAKLALNGVIEERNVGQRTTLDVLNAQADVITAQINLVSSERDVVVASYAILSAVGRLSAGRVGLNVVEYKPDEHYNAVKDKWFGLRTPDGR